MTWLKGYHVSKGIQSLDFPVHIYPAGMSTTCLATRPKLFVSPFLGAASFTPKAAATFQLLVTPVKARRGASSGRQDMTNM